MRERREAGGFTLIEVLVVIAILATLAGMVSLLLPKVKRKGTEFQCVSHVRELTGLLEAAQAQGYPAYGGPNLLLYLVKKGELAGRDTLELLFCPGDEQESFRLAGGEEAYVDLDLQRRGEYGHLTSYAGRAQDEAACRTGKGKPRPRVLVCDDSSDHHQGGLVVGLTGGVAKFRDLVDDYGLDAKAALAIGAGSQVDELKCLRTD